MKMAALSSIYNAEPAIFTNKQGSLLVTKESFIRNLAVLRGDIYLLYPGGHLEVILLRESAIDAGYTSDEQKKNQVIPV